MVENSTDLRDIESCLREAIEEHARARVRGDFYENVFRVHAPVRQALDMRLSDEDKKNLTFSQKCRRIIPNAAERWRVDELTRDRNFLAHPDYRADDELVWKTSVRLVDLACDAWPVFFSSAVPPVIHPYLTQETDDAPPRAPTPVPPASSGGSSLSQVRAPSVPTTSQPRRTAWTWLAAGLIVLVLCLAVGGYGVSRDHIMTAASTGIIRPTGTPRPQDSARGIGIGSEVRVAVPEEYGLKLHEGPGGQQTELAQLGNGARLVVVAGPVVTTDGWRWWKVAPVSGESGWCAGGWLRPAE